MSMTKDARSEIEKTLRRHTGLEACRGEIERAVELVVSAYRAGRKVLTAGNGGSSADADHIVGELMKRFARPRPLAHTIRTRIENAPIESELKRRLEDGLEQPLKAVNLAAHTALYTAFANDADPALAYAQALLGFADAGDVLIAISTSGGSENVVAAAALARALDVSVIALTGASGGRLAELADAAIRAPAHVTAEVQEYHLPIYHTICAAVEAELFP
jgi:D-sedoheptulose 7-phosphate isomerase